MRHTSQAPHGEAGIVYYRDGTTKTLPDLNVKTIEKFVSTRGDSVHGKISETVEKVDLFLDSKFLKDGVMLVDSPGLNGITENLEAITRRQIKESHACIFMFTAERPGTRVEFEMLRDLRTECNRIFIVLNKVEDIKKSEDETPESVVEHLRERHKEFFADEKLPEIYPISASFALSARDKDVPLERDADRVKDAAYYSELEKRSLLGVFEDRLFRYLTEGERTREQLSEPVNKVANTLKYEQDDLNEQIKVLEESRSTTELEQQKLALEEGIAQLQKQSRTLTKPLNERFQSALRDFKDKINARCSDICRRIEITAEEIESVDELQSFAAEVPNSLKKDFLKLSQRLEEDLREDLMLVAEESVEYFDELQDTLSRVSGGELKIHNRDMKLTVAEVGKNMETMEKAFAEKRREMERIEEQIDNAQLSRAKARTLERRKENLQSQLREIATRRNAVFDVFNIPPVEIRTRTVTKLRDRRGLGGAIAQLFFGQKEYQETVEEPDPTSQAAHAGAKQKREEILNDIDEERVALLKEMDKYSSVEVGSSEEFDVEIQLKSKQLEQLHENYKADVAKYMASLDADTTKARKKICREIKSYVEDFAEENIQSINRYLAGIERKMFDSVRTVIEARVNAEIERQQKKMEMLIEDSKASDAKRDEKLQRAIAGRDTVKELLGRVAEIGAELDEMNDHIAQEA